MDSIETGFTDNLESVVKNIMEVMPNKDEIKKQIDTTAKKVVRHDEQIRKMLTTPEE